MPEGPFKQVSAMTNYCSIKLFQILSLQSHQSFNDDEKFLLDYLRNTGSMVLGHNFLQLTNTLAYLAVASLTKKQLKTDNLVLDH